MKYYTEKRTEVSKLTGYNAVALKARPFYQPESKVYETQTCICTFFISSTIRLASLLL